MMAAENPSNYLETNQRVKDNIKIEFYNEDFKKLFNEIKFHPSNQMNYLVESSKISGKASI